MKLYAIWCKDKNSNKGDWLKELPAPFSHGYEGILAFTSKRNAQGRAAEEYGFDTYTEAKRKGWCEVKEISAIGE